MLLRESASVLEEGKNHFFEINLHIRNCLQRENILLRVGDRCQYSTGCKDDMDCNGPKVIFTELVSPSLSFSKFHLQRKYLKIPKNFSPLGNSICSILYKCIEIRCLHILNPGSGQVYCDRGCSFPKGAMLLCPRMAGKSKIFLKCFSAFWS